MTKPSTTAYIVLLLALSAVGGAQENKGKELKWHGVLVKKTNYHSMLILTVSTREGEDAAIFVDSKLELTRQMGDAVVKVDANKVQEGSVLTLVGKSDEQGVLHAFSGQVYCTEEGPTRCNKADCHHKCKDGPCACPK